MRDPAKHRLHDYEAGWLTLLVAMGVATEEDAREAQNRVAQEAVQEAIRRRELRRAARDRRRRRDAE